MLKVKSIEVEKEVNEKFSQKSLMMLLENRDVIVNETGITSFVTLLNHIIEEFEQEVLIGTFDDINDYVEYYIERCREY